MGGALVEQFSLGGGPLEIALDRWRQATISSLPTFMPRPMPPCGRWP
jgi:hypothetical protein